jgi:hypothetical protein
MSESPRSPSTLRHACRHAQRHRQSQARRGTSSGQAAWTDRTSGRGTAGTSQGASVRQERHLPRSSDLLTTASARRDATASASANSSTCPLSFCDAPPHPMRAMPWRRPERSSAAVSGSAARDLLPPTLVQQPQKKTHSAGAVNTKRTAQVLRLRNSPTLLPACFDDCPLDEGVAVRNSLLMRCLLEGHRLQKDRTTINAWQHTTSRMEPCRALRGAPATGPSTTSAARAAAIPADCAPQAPAQRAT